MIQGIYSQQTQGEAAFEQHVPKGNSLASMRSLGPIPREDGRVKYEAMPPRLPPRVLGEIVEQGAERDLDCRLCMYMHALQWPADSASVPYCAKIDD